MLKKNCNNVCNVFISKKNNIIENFKILIFWNFLK